MDIILINYIKHCTDKGIPREKIKVSLIKAGWKEPIVDQALSVSQTSAKKPSINLKMWKGPTLLALILLIVANVYNLIYFGVLSPRSMLEATAAAAALMIGISLALSSMSYYFNFLDNKLAYRKEVGLIGYFLALTYSMLLAISRPEMYISGLFNNFLTADVLLGMSAMAILSAMAIVSINKVMMKITPLVGRRILRLGYLAYFLLILRAVFLQHETWLAWFTLPNGLPPARLVLSFFAAFVIILRLTMAISLRFKNSKQVVPNGS